MSLYYFVRDYNNNEKKIYLDVRNILMDIPNRFTIKVNNYPFEYWIEDVEIESGKLEVFIPMFICGIIGLLIHPLGGIIGGIIGLFIGLSKLKIDEYELKKAKKELEKLINLTKLKED